MPPPLEEGEEAAERVDVYHGNDTPREEVAMTPRTAEGAQEDTLPRLTPTVYMLVRRPPRRLTPM